MNFRRILQAASLVFFLLLLWLAAFPPVSPLPVDLFLRADPAAFAGAALSARNLLISHFWIAAVFLGSTLLLGRFFCGMICPMGTTLDAADALIRRKSDRNSRIASHPFRRLKYGVLLVLVGAALAGISLVFLAAPIPMITRFYGLVIHPVLSLIAEAGLTLIRPAARWLDLPSFAYLQVRTPRFAYPWLTVGLFAGIFAGALLSPRFWCRNLCPAGALFALASFRPLLRRSVSSDCTGCGKCRAACPMGAIPEDPFRTETRECVVCETCSRICPFHAIDFSFGGSDREYSGDFSRSRRGLLLAGLSGLGAGLVARTGFGHLHGVPGPGRPVPADLIRPPGALPETDFLSRCLRCGECMKACPLNSLQPFGLAIGIAGLFTPKVVPRGGPCEPACNACGHVCPTGAIRAIPLAEKIWAKIGTAQVLRQKCLAWEFGKRCLVCDETCPYDAVEFRQVPEVRVAVPFVNESRCSGCGYCEFSCPVQGKAAIVVEPMEAIRIETGSYRKRAEEAGLSLRLKPKEHVLPGPPSGGEERPGLPPGFTE